MHTLPEHTTRLPAPEQSRALSEQALCDLRSHIDRLDLSIVNILAERFRLAEEVITRKVGEGSPVLDPRREAEIVRNASRAARELGVPDEGLRQVFWSVIDWCREGVRSRARPEGHSPGTSGEIRG